MPAELSPAVQRYGPDGLVSSLRCSTVALLLCSSLCCSVVASCKGEQHPPSWHPTKNFVPTSGVLTTSATKISFGHPDEEALQSPSLLPPCVVECPVATRSNMEVDSGVGAVSPLSGVSMHHKCSCLQPAAVGVVSGHGRNEMSLAQSSTPENSAALEKPIQPLSGCTSADTQCMSSREGPFGVIDERDPLSADSMVTVELILSSKSERVAAHLFINTTHEEHTGLLLQQCSGKQEKQNESVEVDTDLLDSLGSSDMCTGAAAESFTRDGQCLPCCRTAGQMELRPAVVETSPPRSLPSGLESEREGQWLGISCFTDADCGKDTLNSTLQPENFAKDLVQDDQLIELSCGERKVACDTVISEMQLQQMSVQDPDNPGLDRLVGQVAGDCNQKMQGTGMEERSECRVQVLLSHRQGTVSGESVKVILVPRTQKNIIKLPEHSATSPEQLKNDRLAVSVVPSPIKTWEGIPLPANTCIMPMSQDALELPRGNAGHPLLPATPKPHPGCGDAVTQRQCCGDQPLPQQSDSDAQCICSSRSPCTQEGRPRHHSMPEQLCPRGAIVGHAQVGRKTGHDCVANEGRPIT